MRKSNRGLSVHLVPSRTPSETKFALTEAGEPQPLIRPTTQERAIETARAVAKEVGGGLFFIVRISRFETVTAAGNPSSQRDRN